MMSRGVFCLGVHYTKPNGGRPVFHWPAVQEWTRSQPNKETPRGPMASFHAKDGYIYIDFRWRGLRCREATRVLERAKLRARTLYQTRHTNAEMVYRRYHRFIPSLRERDGALAAKGLADEGL